MVKLIHIEEKGLRMRLKKRRSELIIIYDLLSLLEKQELKKTHLMYKTNMTFTQFNKYLGVLLIKGLLNEKGSKNGGKIYFVTDKGKRLMESLDVVMNYLE